MSTVSASFYLCLSKGGRSWSGLRSRITSKAPALAAGEVAVHLTVTLPAALFTRPTLKATIDIPADRVAAVITADVATNISALLSEQLGMRVEVTAP